MTFPHAGTVRCLFQPTQLQELSPIAVCGGCEITASVPHKNGWVVYNFDMVTRDKPNIRRRLHFSIKALLVVTALCAILFAWWRDHTQLQHELEMVVRRAMENEIQAREDSRMAKLMTEKAKVSRDIADQITLELQLSRERLAEIAK